MRITRMNWTSARTLLTVGLVGVISACANDAFTSSEPPPSDPDSMPTAGTGAIPVPMGTAPGNAPAAGSSPGEPGPGSAGTTSGSGGTTASGGASGAGATGSASDGVAFELDVIDDVESQFPHILESDGRNGFWFIADDGSEGTLSALEAYALQPPRGDSDYAARVSGAGFMTWGAALGVTFKSPLSAYDASAFCGLRFYASGHGNGWALMIADRLSEPDGGICSVDASEPGKQCFDHFGKRFQPTDEWQEHHFTFDELELVKGYSGQERAFEADAIFSLQFVFDNASGADFELLIDDLAFMICE